MGKHVCSREGVLGSNPTTPDFLPNVFAARWRLLKNATSKGHHSRYITLFFEGTHTVIGFYELMGMFILNWFYHLLWFYFLTVSEFSCLAKSYSVSGLTPLLHNPNQLHFIGRSAHEVLDAN